MEDFLRMPYENIFKYFKIFVILTYFCLILVVYLTQDKGKGHSPTTIKEMIIMTAKQINEMKFLARVIETIKMTTATRAHEAPAGYEYADKYDENDLYDLILVPVPEDKYFYNKFIEKVMLRATDFGILDGKYIINFCTEKICNILLYSE